MYLFNERKATEATLYFLLQTTEKKINLLKLMKLLYLAERLSFQKFHAPLIGDSMYSLPHGPVLSNTLSCMNGELEHMEYWQTYIKDKADHFIGITSKAERLTEDDLLELSDADIQILNEIWIRYGKLNQWQLRDYTHRYCAEWRNPNGSALPISYKDLFQALDFSPALCQDIIQDLESYSRFNETAHV